jgi:hypothetical protein
MVEKGGWTEQVVELGITDGASVAVTSGLNEGDVVRVTKTQTELP